MGRSEVNKAVTDIMLFSRKRMFVTFSSLFFVSCCRFFFAVQAAGMAKNNARTTF